ncbi:hypothetical protein JCM11251_006200 [Rhodosporidiobolus azoricus]
MTPTPMSTFFSPSRPSRQPSNPPPGAPTFLENPSRTRPSGAGNLFSSSSSSPAGSSSSSSTSKLIKRATNRHSRFGLGGGGGLTQVAPVVAEEESEEVASTSQESFGWDGRRNVGDDEGWFEEYHPPGGLEVQKYAKDLASFVSYSKAASNWDSLRTSALFLGSLRGSPAFPIDTHANGSTTPTMPPPHKVLDIGAGTTPFWVLEMASTWTETEFTALDVAPTALAPGLLPPDLAPRISTVQANFKDPLPFEDGAFDFVRVAFLNNAMSEQHWATVIEEGMRVLKPGCFFEVVEQDTAVWRKRGAKDDNLPRSSLDSSDRFSTIDGVFKDVLNDRFINPSPLTVIPSNLAMNGTQVRSTGKITFPVFADPPSYDASTASPLPDTGSNPDLQQPAMPLERYSAGSTAQTTLLRTNEVRVLLAAYADKWASSSYGLARAAVSSRTRARSDSRWSRTSSGPDDLFASSDIPAAHSAAFSKEVQDVEDQIHAWADDLRERASIAQLLTSRFGWAPTVDNQMLFALQGNIPVLDSKLKELSQRKEVQDSIFGEVDPELEYRLQQMEFGRREAEGEVRAVRERLYGPERKEGEGTGNEVLGSLDTQAFVCKAY